MGFVFIVWRLKMFLFFSGGGGGDVGTQSKAGRETIAKKTKEKERKHLLSVTGM
jgi:hypothetical protein